ncbi:MAG: UDP-N-acetylmuramate--L-alanine ligase, partial [Acidimicrobiaceae bacterium]|nr:UDP-N-acetylmuramate--L-alanine ligase [Acidimicrobiaceae bacterium]
MNPREASATAGWAGDLSIAGRYHVVGVGGSGMSAIATVLAAMGHTVSGSDARGSGVLDRLAGHGVETWAGHHPERLTTPGAAHLDAVTASTAVPADDPELAAARSMGVPVLSRADMLAAICALRRTLAVAGTHGKTTTSAMLAGLLVAADLHPSFIVGGDIVGVGPGARWDRGEWLVVEADESDGTFLRLPAEGVIVTSVEPDHLDFYGDVAHLEAAFETFATAAPGPRVICIDGPAAAALATKLGPDRLTTYGGTAGAGLRVEDVRSDRGGVRFSLRGAGASSGTVRLAVPGRHNALNATAALGLALAIGVEPEVAIGSLETFGGVARRFERRGEREGITFVDDYAHLPNEVKTAVGTARDGGWERVVVVFQPHRYSRTAALWRDFADSFVGADVVMITDVYPSGEAPRRGVGGHLVARAVAEAHADLDLRYLPD